MMDSHSFNYLVVLSLLIVFNAANHHHVLCVSERESDTEQRQYASYHKHTGGAMLNDLIERSSWLNSLMTRYMGYGYSNNYENKQQDYCCDSLYEFDTIVPGFALLAAALFFFYMLNSTVTSGRRRRDNQQQQQGKSIYRLSYL